MNADTVLLGIALATIVTSFMILLLCQLDKDE